MILSDSAINIKNIGEQRLKLLNKVNIHTVNDLIEYFPRDYQDRSLIKKINELKVDQINTFKGVVIKKPEVIKSNGMPITKAKVEDETGSIEIIWFNQPYLKNSITVKTEYIFTGKVSNKYNKLQVESPDFESTKKKQLLSNGRIVPIYHLTKNLSQKVFRSLVKHTLDNVRNQITEFMPNSIRQEFNLCSRVFAIENIHFPQNDESFFLARKSLVFEELFLFQMKLLQLKGNIKSQKSDIVMNNFDTSKIEKEINFKLTNAQIKVIDEIISDFKSNTIMNRLIQGDVGCGKTIVAMFAAFIAINNGYQAALMTPTDVLANQHFDYFCRIFDKIGIRCVLLSGSMKKKDKRLSYEKIQDGRAKMIIGTHALIQDCVIFDNLGLVITDEQHRFGVNQRINLNKKGQNPHTLVMTATPIPRTLALILYGDLDISVIDSLPPGRQCIDTIVVNSSYYQRIYSFIKKNADSGRQAYIICPVIEENDNKELKAVNEYTQKLKDEVFNNYKVECIHGKMKNDYKQFVMSEFVSGKIDILVSTTVIEVGINVPNSTIMLIENAERFGLAQLHQLRGRVGRGSQKSYCILISDSKSKISKERLNILKKSNDGFEISEKDLNLRGPGDFFGTKQHGLPELKIANLYKDIDILKSVQTAAQNLYISDPNLENPENYDLNCKIEDIFRQNDNNVSL